MSINKKSLNIINKSANGKGGKSSMKEIIGMIVGALFIGSITNSIIGAIVGGFLGYHIGSEL